MNDKRVNQYLILPENGQRKDTKLAVEHSEEQIAELLKQGYVIVGNDDFNKLIGNGDGEYLIADDGVVYPKPAPTDAELLAVAKPAQIAELKLSVTAKRLSLLLTTATAMITMAKRASASTRPSLPLMYRGLMRLLIGLRQTTKMLR